MGGVAEKRDAVDPSDLMKVAGVAGVPRYSPPHVCVEAVAMSWTSLECHCLCASRSAPSAWQFRHSRAAEVTCWVCSTLLHLRGKRICLSTVARPYPVINAGSIGPTVDPYPPAGTLSAVLRISCRSDVNSEIVLVATDATGRALRPVGSVLDTITTLSMYG